MTIFAYGQTGSGKGRRMNKNKKNNEEIIKTPKICKEIIQKNNELVKICKKRQQIRDCL